MLGQLLDSWPRWTVGAVLVALVPVVPSSLGLPIGALFRYAAIAAVYSFVLLELAAYAVVRVQIHLLEALIGTGTSRALRRARKAAGSYGEWTEISKKLDASEARRKSWASDLNDWTAAEYSWTYLEQLMGDLRLAREHGDFAIAAATLSQCLRKNVGGIFSVDLYSHLHTGRPKEIVEDFVREIVTTLVWATRAAEGSEKKRDAVRRMLDQAVTTYGQRGLCLSGGGMMGCYHYGLVKALHEESLLPKIISGASAGALVAAFVCTRTDEELDRDLNPEVVDSMYVCCARPWPDRIRALLMFGSMFDNDEWIETAKPLSCGDLTFREAYEKTGRTLCITLSTTSRMSPPILLNHLSAPDVVIASAVVASACVPGLLTPMTLQSKTADGKIEDLKEEYWDGSIQNDIPMDGMAEQLNCQFFIVSQLNPHIVPFDFHADGSPGEPNRWKKSRRGGYLLSGLEMLIKLDMIKNLTFLKDVGAVQGVTSNLMTQGFGGSTTIVPRVSFRDYFKLMDDPNLDDMKRYFQGGSVAAYGSVAMIRLHYDIARTIDECRDSLDMPKGGSYDLQKQLDELDFEEENDDVWVPIRYSSRQTILKGAMARARRGTLFVPS